ncbi:MAG: hypothetical protein IMY76_06865 [Chloroflexi bacterium]|nr:hypothetical protein [Chloroflexota bacterium]
MTNQYKSFPIGLRFLTFLIGLAFLFWLSFEDDQIWLPTMMASVASLLWAFRISYSRTIHTLKDIVWQTWIGIIAALAVTPLAVILIFFKSGLHNHVAPDFTPAQILFLLQRTPHWAGVGLLIGLGSSIGRMTGAAKK